jgi:sulfate/thiosulfate transport system permease protein
MTTFTFRKPSALPGFGLTLGVTVAYLSLVVLIPLAATFAKTATLDWTTFVRAVTSPRAAFWSPGCWSAIRFRSSGSWTL